MKVQKQIEVRFLKKRVIAPVDVVQYDTGIQLVFSVADFTLPSETTATLYIQKKSGKFVYQESGITVSENDITVDLENQALTEYGEAKYQLQLKNGTDVITTFAGVLRVEKSLADSRAEESKTVISAFDELTAEQLAEFQIKAEQIVQACIATIPEDYTVMEAKVNELANAVKGSLSGGVVRADDVSPVEHNPAVSVHGKNLLQPVANNVDGQVWQCTVEIAEDGKITLTNKKTSGVAFARIGTLELKKGKTYVYSRTDPSNVSNVVAWHTGTTTDVLALQNGVPFTLSKNVTADIAVYMSDISAVGNTSSVYIQIEEGETATDYEQYIDPSTVTVRRCGKNLVPTITDKVHNGITWSISDDGSITLNGTASSASSAVIPLNLPAGKYTLSANNSVAVGSDVTSSPYIVPRAIVDEAVAWIQTLVCNAKNKTGTFSAGVQIRDLLIAVPPDVTLEQFTIKLQIETGSSATDYETYNGTEYTPTADGTVPGVTSVSPNMTILTDTDGVTVECEYNRDTNNVIDKLIDAITALGGKV